jgi:hypothetical protein
MKQTDLGFQVTTIIDGSFKRTVARFTCRACPSSIDMTVTSGKPLDPEGLAKRAMRHGWLTRPFQSSRTYCPRCAGKKRDTHDPDSELKKVSRSQPRRRMGADCWSCGMAKSRSHHGRLATTG